MERRRARPYGSILSWITITCGLAALSAPGLASAGDGSRSEPEPEFTVAAEAAYERLGEDDYISSAAKLGVSLPVPALLCDGDSNSEDCQTRFRAGLQAPFRLRIADRGENNPGLLRDEDWDETSDYLRTVRYVEYGSRSEPVFGRIGELGALSIGHGTIVNNYFNVVSPDHYRAGFNAEIETPHGGGAALVNDVVRPTVVGGRGYIRPGSWFAPASWISKFSIGVSLVGDVRAPERLARRRSNQPRVRDDRHPAVSAQRTTGIGGLDLSLPVVDTDPITLVPYSDLNVHFGVGHGVHAGLLAESRPVEVVELSGRFEFRALDDRYLPDYFGPLYEIDRYQFLGWGVLLPQPKLRVAAESREERTLGGYGEVTARVGERVAASAAYAGHEGPDNSKMRLSLQLSPVRRFQFGLFYFKQNFDGVGNLVEREGTFLVTESRARILGPLYAKASYGLRWRLRDDGVYQPIDQWSAGAGVSFGF